MLSRLWTQSACLVAITVALATGDPAFAADPDDRPGPPLAATVQPPPQADPDFLFGRPRAFYGIYGGWLLASQRGGVFDFTREHLTVDEGAFDSALIRFAFGLALAARADLRYFRRLAGGEDPPAAVESRALP